MAALLKKLESFEECLVLARLNSEKADMSLRYVNIIRDLSMLYQWLNDKDPVSNFRQNANDSRLIKRFRQALESPARQPFLAEQQSVPVCLFDLSLINLHELYYRLPTSSGDCILDYCLAGSRDQIPVLENALRMLLDYFFSFPEHRRIWVTIPVQQSAVTEQFGKNGFSVKGEYTARQQRYAIFYLNRKDHTILTGTGD